MEIIPSIGKEGEPRDFEKALELCKDSGAREEIRRAQADYYFHKNDYLRAAEYDQDRRVLSLDTTR